jgi:hypothetical protein
VAFEFIAFLFYGNLIKNRSKDHDMADNFLYILGAGASCEAVPLVRDFPKSLADFAKQLSNCGSLFEKDKPEVLANALYDWQQEFIKALKWLATEADQNGSVDTSAKKFFLKGDLQNLKKLKAVLSSFLMALFTISVAKIQNRARNWAWIRSTVFR